MMWAIALSGIAAGMVAAAIVARGAVQQRHRRQSQRARRRIDRDANARLNGWLYEWLWARHRRKRLTYRPEGQAWDRIAD